MTGCNGISRLPDTDGDKPLRSKFKHYPLGYFHIYIAEVRTEEGRLYLLVAIDRNSKFAFVELHEKATRRVAGNFLRVLAAAVPYQIHTLSDQFDTIFVTLAGRIKWQRRFLGFVGVLAVVGAAVATFVAYRVTNVPYMSCWSGEVSASAQTPIPPAMTPVAPAPTPPSPVSPANAPTNASPPKPSPPPDPAPPTPSKPKMAPTPQAHPQP